jgi:hypothetical protein
MIDYDYYNDDFDYEKEKEYIYKIAKILAHCILFYILILIIYNLFYF